MSAFVGRSVVGICVDISAGINSTYSVKIILGIKKDAANAPKR
jgi:hypothetical protein